MDLFAQLLLESRTGAYIEWLDNKLNMAANNNINKDSQLALLSTKKKENQQTIKLVILLGVRKLSPLVG